MTASGSDAGGGRAAAEGAPEPEVSTVLLRNATLADGSVRDVLISDGRIAAVATGLAADNDGAAAVGAVHDLTGYLLLPSAVEPHAHLDRALLGGRFPNPDGDLAGAIEAVRGSYPAATEAEILGRARTALTAAVSHGYTAVRTHAACEAGLETRAVRALARLRDEVSQIVDLQVVALVAPPLTGTEGAAQRQRLAEAIRAGTDVIGGAPWLDDHPAEAITVLVEAAAEAGLPLDLHLDETTDADVATLSTFAEQVTRCGLSGRATASHCVSLGQQEPEAARAVAGELAAAGIAVVTLPQTNLYLQGRGTPTRVPRGLTALHLLREAGVTVAAGGDNWRDPFNPLSRIDPLETAGLLVAAAHLSPADAYRTVSQECRRVLDLAPVAMEPGSDAELLAVRAPDVADAIAAGTEDRWVFRRGRLVSRTRLVQDVVPDIGPGGRNR